MPTRKQRRIVDNNLEGKYYGQSLPSPTNPTSNMNMKDLGNLGSKSLDAFRKFMESGMGGSGSGNSSQTPKAGSPLNILEKDRSYWSNVLAMLGHNTEQTDFLNSLLGIGAENAGRIGAYPEDIRKKLIEMYLNNMVSQEQRGYDQSVLQEQRLYDSPTNQLARLMGAGISRDAAIQMLSQGGETPMIGSGAGLSAGEPFQSTTEQVMQGLETAAGFASAFSSLISLGFTIPQALAQTDLLRTQSYLSQRQRQAFDAASEAYGVLQNAGVDINEKTFGNIANVSKIITELANGGNFLAQGFVSRKGLQTLNDTAPYSMPFLNQMYKNHRDSADYNREFELRMGNEEARKDLANVTASKLLVEMTAIQDKVDNLRADTNYKKALSALVGSQKTQVDLQNQLDASWRTDEGMADYSSSVRARFKVECLKLTSLSNPELWQKQAERMLKDEELALFSLELGMLYKRGALDIVTNNGPELPTLLSLCDALEQAHYWDYVDSVVKKNTGGKLSVFGVSSTTSAFGFGDKEVNPSFLIAPEIYEKYKK